MNNNKLFLLTTLTLLIFNPIHAEEKKDYFSDACCQYLASLPLLKNEKTEINLETLKQELAGPTPLSINEQTHIIFNIMQKTHHPDEHAVALDKNFLKKMELFCGDAEPNYNLFDKLDNTVTIAGRYGLVELLSCPTFDTEILKTRQQCIKELLNNEKLADSLEKVLSDINKSEEVFLSNWQEENAAEKEMLKKVYFSSFPTLNKSTLALDVKTRKELGIFALQVLQFPISIALGLTFQEVELKLKHNIPVSFSEGFATFAKAFKNLFKLKKNIFNPESGAAALPSSFTLGDGIYAAKESITALYKQQDNKTLLLLAGTVGLSATLLGGIYSYQFYKSYKDITFQAKITQYLQAKLMATSHFIRGYQQLITIVNEHTPLKNALSNTKLDEMSDACASLLKKLNSYTFRGKPSFFSLFGRILATHTLLQEIKDELLPFIKTVGEVDALYSIAKLAKKHQDASVSYCFAEYISDQATPYIHAKNFWNPFLDPQKAVPNSVNLGNQAARNMVLTGPNSGGKSTILKGLMLNAYLALTLTIVPAESFAFTPFTSLHCSLNISDEIGVASLFQAEVNRAKELLQDVRGLKPGNFSFIVMDEIFNGTSPKEGEDAAFKYADILGAHTNCLCILATHFPLLTTLDAHDYFKNYHVAMYKNEYGSWVRPFKLEEGKSEQNIAHELLEEAGIF